MRLPLILPVFPFNLSDTDLDGLDPFCSDFGNVDSLS
jgi:hypothetical protein